jgi:hypothetical protein
MLSRSDATRGRSGLGARDMESTSGRLKVGILVAVMGAAPAPAAPAAQPAVTDSSPGTRITSGIPGPIPGTEMTKEYVQMVGRMAYVWGYPLVSSYNRRAAIALIPAPGLSGGVAPVAPVGHLAMLTDYIKPEQNVIACPNQDVVDGSGYFTLDAEPIIVQVPDFGNRFWVYGLYDARTDAFAAIGKPYETKPGFYMIVGPEWRGRTPAGVSGFVRCSTELASIVPRVFKDDTPEDTKAVQAVLGQIMAYPLSQFDGTMKTTDWSKLPSLPASTSRRGEVNWVDPEKFFDRLPGIIAVVRPLPGEEALYGWIQSVWGAAEKDPELKKALTESFVAADRDIIAPLIQWRYNGRAVGNGWYSPANNAQWGTDYLNRAATSKSNMYENRPNETKYMYRDLDGQGQPLNGTNGYTMTFPKGQFPPTRGFWSLTLYNEQHVFHANPLNRYSLGTKSKGMKYDADGSLTLYFGAKSPGKGKEANWVPAPEGPFSLYFRCYWPEQEVIEGSWRPPAVVRSN